MSLRVLGPAALALVLSSLVPAAPAHAEEQTLTTRYACDSAYGGGSSAVTVKVDLPGQVTAGRQVDARRINFKIVIPDELADSLRGRATAVSATATAKYRVGGKRIRIRDLTIPRTDIPDDGRIVIRGSGRAAAFTVDEPGRYAVRVPKGIAADVTAHGTPFGDVTVPVTCTLADGAPAKLATLTVVR